MRIGTRGSALALIQAEWVADRIAADTEIVTVTTAGDRGIGEADKSRWISELERALLAGEIDLAVHSGKDVPTELPDGLELVAIPERADPRDALCGAASLSALPPGARVGTSSLRRAAQLRAEREDLEIVPVRGNVDTRLRKLAAGEYDALVLALAGLARLGRGDEAEATLEGLVPAAAQGALAVEALTGRDFGSALDGVRDAAATICVNAERELVHTLGASCNTPVGAYAVLAGANVKLCGWVGLPDGSRWISDRLTGSADGLGRVVAERMLAAGAGDILAEAERQVTG